MIKGQDVVVLLKLLDEPSAWTVRSLSGELGLPSAGVHRSLRRLADVGLYDLDRRRPNFSRAQEFLVHAAKYLFPPRFGRELRGIPTAWAVSPLREELAPQKGLPLVWPHPQGDVRGVALEPLHASVPEIAQRDPVLGQQLALVDAIRLGDARISSLAAELLADRVMTDRKSVV